jgi:hypothetical protein
MLQGSRRGIRVSWSTAHKALVVAATKWLPESVPTNRLGIDETRFPSVRWILDGIVWKRSDPWLTSFVDCSADGPGSLLGLAPGRTGGRVRERLGEQSEAFRNAIKIVVIVGAVCLPDPHRPAGCQDRIGQVAPWSRSPTRWSPRSRQRVTRDLLGRRGTVADSSG